MSQSNRTAGKRIPELDGVRGVAILMVLLWHYIQNQLVVQTGSPLAYLKQSLGFTWSGVNLFFVLSGFLIAGILLDNRHRQNYFSVFYIRRSCRIFPLYYLYIAIFLAMVFFGAGNIPFLHGSLQQGSVPVWSYVTYTQNIFMGLNNTEGIGWLGVTWSLAVEEQFYLVLPLLIYYFPRSYLPYVFLWFLLTAIYLRYSLPGLSAFINMPWRADSLMTGALLAYFVRIPAFSSYVKRHRWQVLSALAVLVAAIAVANNHGKLSLIGPVTHISLALMFGLFILYVINFRDGILAVIMRNRVLMWLGSISYGVYLFHTNISKVLHGLIRNAHPQIANWSAFLVTMLALVITLLLAHISFYYFERRVIRYGHKYQYE